MARGTAAFHYLLIGCPTGRRKRQFKFDLGPRSVCAGTYPEFCRDQCRTRSHVVQTTHRCAFRATNTHAIVDDPERQNAPLDVQNNVNTRGIAVFGHIVHGLLDYAVNRYLYVFRQLLTRTRRMIGKANVHRRPRIAKASLNVGVYCFFEAKKLQQARLHVLN